jgi:hypothetical protein
LERFGLGKNQVSHHVFVFEIARDNTNSQVHGKAAAANHAAVPSPCY